MNLLFLFYKFDVSLHVIGIFFLLVSIQPSQELTEPLLFEYLAFIILAVALALRMIDLSIRREWMMEKHKKQEHQTRINKDKVMVELLKNI
jgi:hypothetical protein